MVNIPVEVREQFEAVAADDPLDALDAISYVREWLRIAELHAITQARESGESLSDIGDALATDRQNVHQKLQAATQTKGLTGADFDGVSNGTLRYWHRWWSKPERAATGTEESGRDPAAQRQRVWAELDARWNAGLLRTPPPSEDRRAAKRRGASAGSGDVRMTERGEMNTIAVDVRDTIGTRVSVKAAAAWAWGGSSPARPATRIVAQVDLVNQGEFVSRSGGNIESHVEGNRRFFHEDDMVEAERVYPDDLSSLWKPGRLPFRRF